jgi:hypothetical protein
VARTFDNASSVVRRRVKEISEAVLDASGLEKYAVLIASRAERLARTSTK